MSEEAKVILRQYMHTPISKIPESDLEKFYLALIEVQAEIGSKKFKDFLEGKKDE